MARSGLATARALRIDWWWPRPARIGGGLVPPPGDAHSAGFDRCQRTATVSRFEAGSAQRWKGRTG